MSKKDYDVIIIGAGPTGIFTAMEFIKKEADLDILILEKGTDLERRVCPMKENPGMGCVNCPSCAIVSGWGGAGAYSDGKLSLPPDIGGNLENYIGRQELIDNIAYADDIYMEFGAPDRVFGVAEDKQDEIRKKAVRAELKFIPASLRHLGTGYSQVVLQNMQDYLEEQGVEIRFGVNVKQFIVEADKIEAVKTAAGEKISAEYVMAAAGRENAEWLTNEAKKMDIETAINPVDIGVRVECPAAITEYMTDNLYESKLIYHTPTFEDKVRTFCMSPYGEVVSENNQGLITVNGHSHSDIKTNNTNFALLVSKTFTEPFHEPITYGKDIAKLANMLAGGVLVQRLGDLLEGRRTTEERLKRSVTEATLKDATPGDLSLVLPHRHLTGIIEMLKALDKITPGIYGRDTLLYGVEVKFYSSRLNVDNNLESKVENLFFGGDGAGITRGLMQASVSGIVIARSIMKKLNKEK